MRPRDLDFLRPLPATPRVSWLLLAVGVAVAGLALTRYQEVSADLARERQAARQATPSPRSLPARSAAAGNDAALLARDWNGLFDGLERSLPDDIALLELEADGRKGVLALTAETTDAQAMLGYLQRLRDEAGLQAAVLRNHAVRQDDPEAPLRFAVRAPWGQP